MNTKTCSILLWATMSRIKVTPRKTTGYFLMKKDNQIIIRWQKLDMTYMNQIGTMLKIFRINRRRYKMLLTVIGKNHFKWITCLLEVSKMDKQELKILSETTYLKQWKIPGIDKTK